jgi:hypothetical protein
MSIASRVAYLLKIAEKAEKKIEPLVDEFEKIKDIKEVSERELQTDVEELDRKITNAEITGNTQLADQLSRNKEDLVAKVTGLTDFSMNTLMSSIEESIQESVDDIDGITVSITSTQDSIIPVISPELVNMTTDFVKGTLLDPTTVASVSTVVTGLAGGVAVTGVGTALAPITTT